MLSRLIYGGRVSLLMGLVPVVVATLVGGFLGVVAGFAGGRINMITMRIVDVFFAFPSVLLAVAMTGAMGPGLSNCLIALCIVFTPSITRIAESGNHANPQPGLYRGRAGLGGASHADYHGAHCEQRHGTNPDVRVEPSQCRGGDRVGPLVPWPWCVAADRGLGVDAPVRCDNRSLLRPAMRSFLV